MCLCCELRICNEKYFVEFNCWFKVVWTFCFKRSVVKRCAFSSHKSIQMLLGNSQFRLIFFKVFFIRTKLNLHVVYTLDGWDTALQKSTLLSLLHTSALFYVSVLLNAFICLYFGFSFCMCFLVLKMLAWIFTCFTVLKSFCSMIWKKIGFKINLFYCICFCLWCMSLFFVHVSYTCFVQSFFSLSSV